jgi:cellulose 1,4-beta-cellobiosidase
MKKQIRKIGTFALAATLSLSFMMSGSISAASSTGNFYKDAFNEQYDKIKNTANGYFNTQGIPYHSVETIMAEAPDYGHESSSEAVSYYIWLEAMKGNISGDFSGVAKAWDVIEKYYIPTTADQPAMSKYNASKPATYAPEFETPNQYPAQLDTSAAVGTDPLDAQLKAAYGNSNMYGMHWLIDVDNWYGFGVRGTGTGSPSYINTFQRGEQESTFETITQPCWDALKYGGRNGYLDLFTKDNSYAAQYKYTDAPDADSRAVQATYDAYKWAKAAGKSFDTTLVAKAAKMGDYLRYAMFDKYFRKIGQSTQAGTGYDASTYLLSWYYAWGGDASSQASWAWKIGASHNHQGYQNPMAAWVLSTNSDFKPKSTNATTDWAKSLTTQIDFYTWLQTPEGAIAGGASNSWNGRYEAIPSNVATFNGMGYQSDPVYHDPGSNTWMGFQAWSMQRVAQYYYESKDPKVKELCTRWAKWVTDNIKLDDVKHTFLVPSTLAFSGQPDTWTGARSANSKLSVSIVNYGTDLGVTGSLANALSYIAAANNDTATQLVAKKLLDYMSLLKDSKGIAVQETRADYSRLNDPVYVPAGWTGKMPNGDVIDSNSTFSSIRTNYKKDPDWARVQAALSAGQAPTFTYHRFWAQSDIALAYGTYATLFPSDVTSSLDGLLGDVNSDKTVDAIDLAVLKKYILDSSSVTINQKNSDMNSDGAIDAIDYALLRSLILKGA